MHSTSESRLARAAAIYSPTQPAKTPSAANAEKTKARLQVWGSRSADSTEDLLQLATQVRRSASEAAGSNEIVDARAEARRRANQAVHDRVRSARNELAHLRRVIVRLEEEFKLLGRDKGILEVAIHHKRKELSVNQQSQAMRQKMSTRGRKLTDDCTATLHQEAKNLSTSKRELERQLLEVKNTQLEIDRTKKTLHVKVQVLSKTTSMDHQSLKIFEQTTVRPRRGEQYGCSLPKPPKQVKFDRTDPCDEQSSPTAACDRSPLIQTRDATSCAILQADHIADGSSQLRQTTKEVLRKVAGETHDMRHEVAEKLTASCQHAQREKYELTIERGLVRATQSAAQRSLNSQEIDIGKCRGPASGEHWTVAESPERPLCHLKPGVSEQENQEILAASVIFKQQANRSKSAISRSTDADQRLTLAIHRRSLSARTDSQILRMRRRSADNRWVVGV